MIASTLLIDKLEGNEEFRSADGRAETWASEHLEQKIKHFKKAELVGSIMGVRPIQTEDLQAPRC